MIEWRPVVGYEEYYRVSSSGDIRSLPRKTLSGYGSYRILKPRILKPYKTHRGYLRVDLVKDSVVTHHSIHRVVAFAFLQNPNNKPCINHIDSNKLNNSVDNLEWCTVKENKAHSILAGTTKFKKDKKSHCKHGHEFTLENTYRGARGYRECRICLRNNRNKHRRIHGRADDKLMPYYIKLKANNWKR